VSCLFFDSHKFGLFRRVGRVQEFRHDEAELLELDGLRHVRVEAGFDALRVHVAEDVGGKRDYWDTAVSVFLFPTADFFAGLVAVFIRHM
jgi:hypothetical protein